MADKPQRVYVVSYDEADYDEEASWCVIATSPAEAKDVVRERIRKVDTGITRDAALVELSAKVDRGAGPRVVHTHFRAG